MDPFEKEHYTDDLLADSVSEVDDASLLDDDEIALELIQDYRRQSRRKANRLQAILARINCGLMEIALHSEKSLKNACQSAGEDFLTTSQGQQSLHSHLNLARQVGRYADLDVRLDEIRKQEENIQAQRRTAALRAPSGPRYPMR